MFQTKSSCILARDASVKSNTSINKHHICDNDEIHRNLIPCHGVNHVPRKPWRPDIKHAQACQEWGLWLIALTTLIRSNSCIISCIQISSNRAYHSIHIDACKNSQYSNTKHSKAKTLFQIVGIRDLERHASGKSCKTHHDTTTHGLPLLVLPWPVGRLDPTSPICRETFRRALECQIPWIWKVSFQTLCYYMSVYI